MRNQMMSTASRTGGSGAAGHSRRTFLVAAGGLTTGALLTTVWPCTAAMGAQQCAPPPPPNPPVPFAPDLTTPVQGRKSVADLTPDEIARLGRAYAALRQLQLDDPNDPRGWMQQANVHCYYCADDEREIHGGWWFFPWHRCYLYFHERILGKLVGDMSLRLPYWDWGNSGRRSLPGPYAVASNQDGSPNSLFDQNRGATAATLMDPSYFDGPTSQPGSLAHSMAAPDWQRFAGTANGTGRLERTQHGYVHIWVGDPVNLTGQPDMGILATAARDPVFFTHHANIDRLWTTWRTAASTHTDPDSADWRSQTWTFYDENKRWVSISVADLLDTEAKLRYRYDSPSGGGGQTFALMRGDKPVEVNGTPVTTKLELPAQAREALKTDAQPAEAPGRSVALRIEGVDVPAHKSAVVRVFIDLPEANAKTPVTDPHYAGYFTVLAHSVTPAAHDRKHPAQTVSIDLLPKSRLALSEKSAPTVTLVPMAGDGKLVTQVQFKFDRISLHVLER